MANLSFGSAVLFVWLALLAGRVEAQEVYEGRYIVRAKYDFCDWAPGRNIKECILIKAGEAYRVDRLPEAGISLFASTTEFKAVEYKAADDECFGKLSGYVCEPDYVQKAYGDPYRDQQWGHAAIGIMQPVDATGIKIAVIDSGGCNHEDLKCAYEYDAIEDADGVGRARDDNGHGTHVQGIIAALTDNSLGIAGAQSGAIIEQYKFLGASGGGSTFAAVRAIDRAVQRGVHVINASWGSGGNSAALASAVKRAQETGIIFIAAAGNDGTSNDTRPHYPSNYPGVVSVGSVEASGSVSSFSNFGTGSTTIGAPGGRILSTYPGGRYQYLSGTSMAAPYATAIIASKRRLATPETAIQTTCSQAKKQHLDKFRCGVLSIAAAPVCDKIKCKLCIDRCNKKGYSRQALKKCRKECRSKTSCGIKCR